MRTKCPDANLTHNPKSSLKAAIIHRLLEADSFLWPLARPGLLLWWKFALWDLANQGRVKTIFAAAQIPNTRLVKVMMHLLSHELSYLVVDMI